MTESQALRLAIPCIVDLNDDESICALGIILLMGKCAETVDTLQASHHARSIP
jgi:hypothetical protein